MMPVAEGGGVHNNYKMVKRTCFPPVRRHVKLERLFIKLIPTVGQCLVKDISKGVLDLDVGLRFRYECW